MDFEQLIQILISTGTYLQGHAIAAVNRAATVRNWYFGLFIIEYEQNGQDRAQYGERLIERLSASLSDRGMKGVSLTSLKLCRQFYLVYPEIGQTLTDQLIVSERQIERHRKRLIATLSFSHFVEIIQLDEPLKRLFYEIQTGPAD